MRVPQTNDAAGAVGRLMGAIRVKRIRVSRDVAAPPSPNPSAENKAIPPTAKTTSGRVIVGVDIGHKNVNLVKAAKSHGRWEIPDWRSIP
ncbi:MAG: hypothetical protein M0Z58_10605, partial [Nitrospiraceae bacterium]|nr:hypothetical protein [Nitrospiraceae bacterium]